MNLLLCKYQNRWIVDFTIELNIEILIVLSFLENRNTFERIGTILISNNRNLGSLLPSKRQFYFHQGLIFLVKGINFVPFIRPSHSL